MGPDLCYIASGLVLLTFTAKSMLTVRTLAILSNLALLRNYRFHSPGSVPARDFTAAEYHSASPATG